MGLPWKPNQIKAVTAIPPSYWTFDAFSSLRLESPTPKICVKSGNVSKTIDLPRKRNQIKAVTAFQPMSWTKQLKIFGLSENFNNSHSLTSASKLDLVIRAVTA